MAKVKVVHCHCGQPLHYTNRGIRMFVDAMVRRFGENATLIVGEQTWLIPRHYLALHGLTAQDLPKFEEVKRNRRGRNGSQYETQEQIRLEHP